VLLLAALTLAVLSRRGADPGVVRAAALGLGGLSVVLAVVTTALAVSSY
jgi:hypothetical protein